jgi:aryl-alcohol dehydrogenase-like predicted oxidoreductase
MQYRTLGTTGLKVSVIGIGTWQFGGEWGKTFTQDEVNAILRRGQELGLNLIDTAECYGDHLSESLIGSAVAGQRERWLIATKFGHRFKGFMERTDERDVTHVREQLEASLRALRTDYIDLYQYHSVRDEEFANPALWAFLQQAKQAGKIRHIANSIGSNIDPRFQAEKSSEAEVEALQVVYNRLERKPEELVFPIARRQNLGVLARVPLASGFLSGKYKPGAKFAPGDVRATQDPRKIEEKLREVERIAREEVPSGVDMAEWALAWCLKDPVVSVVIPGCKSVEQVEKNARAAKLVGKI